MTTTSSVVVDSQAVASTISPLDSNVPNTRQQHRNHQNAKQSAAAAVANSSSSSSSSTSASSTGNSNSNSNQLLMASSQLASQQQTTKIDHQEPITGASKPNPNAAISASNNGSSTATTTTTTTATGRKRGRRRQQTIIDQPNGLDRVFIWDIDGSLVRGDTIADSMSFDQLEPSVLASVQDKISLLAKRFKELTMIFCDENFYLNELESSDQMHIDDVPSESAVNSTPISAAGAPTTTCESNNNSNKPAEAMKLTGNEDLSHHRACTNNSSSNNNNIILGNNNNGLLESEQQQQQQPSAEFKPIIVGNMAGSLIGENCLNSSAEEDDNNNNNNGSNGINRDHCLYEGQSYLTTMHLQGEQQRDLQMDTNQMVSVGDELQLYAEHQHTSHMTPTLGAVYNPYQQDQQEQQFHHIGTLGHLQQQQQPVQSALQSHQAGHSQHHHSSNHQHLHQAQVQHHDHLQLHQMQQQPQQQSAPASYAASNNNEAIFQHQFHQPANGSDAEQQQQRSHEALVNSGGHYYAASAQTPTQTAATPTTPQQSADHQPLASSAAAAPTNSYLFDPSHQEQIYQQHGGQQHTQYQQQQQNQHFQHNQNHLITDHNHNHIQVDHQSHESQRVHAALTQHTQIAYHQHHHHHASHQLHHQLTPLVEPLDAYNSQAIYATHQPEAHYHQLTASGAQDGQPQAMAAAAAAVAGIYNPDFLFADATASSQHHNHLHHSSHHHQHHHHQLHPMGSAVASVAYPTYEQLAPHQYQTQEPQLMHQQHLLQAEQHNQELMMMNQHQQQQQHHQQHLNLNQQQPHTHQQQVKAEPDQQQQHQSALQTTTTLRTVLNNHHKQIAHKLSLKFSKIKQVYNAKRFDLLQPAGLGPTPIQNSKFNYNELEDILSEIDRYTLDWRKRSMDCLRLISESNNCTSIIITKLPLISTFGHLLCLGMGKYFSIDQIYSSNKTNKEACLKRIKKKFGATSRCSYIIVGNQEDVELAKKLDLPSWKTSRNDGHRQLLQLFTALKEGYLM